MAKLTRILAGVVLFGSLAGGCREFLPQLDEVPKPVEAPALEREVSQYQRSIPSSVIELVRNEGGEITWLEYGPSAFAIWSCDNPFFEEDALMVGVLDSNFDKNDEKIEMDLVEIVREPYGTDDSRKVISIRRGDNYSEEAFKIVDKLYEGVLMFKNEDLSPEEFYDKHREDINFLLSVK